MLDDELIPNNTLHIVKLRMVAEETRDAMLAAGAKSTVVSQEIFERYMDTFNPHVVCALLSLLEAFAAEKVQKIEIPIPSKHVH